ncbi:MAG: hypothetical protein WC140_05795 [Bacteroidales bacterium]
MKNIYKLKLALIGHGISHSQSPAIFRKAHPNWRYDLLDVDNFDKGYEMFLNEYDAVNVTAPYKVDAYKRADIHDTVCEIIGASNLLVKEDGKIKAYNTDVLGVFACLRMAIDRISGKKVSDDTDSHVVYQADPSVFVDSSKIKVLVIGLGGAGKAATAASMMMGFSTTAINRSFKKTKEFKERLDTGVITEEVDLANKKSDNAESRYELKGLTIADMSASTFSLKKMIANTDIIIYSLPLALPELETIDFTNKIVIEANYHKPTFPEKNCKMYIGGEVWLHAQAHNLLAI